MQTSRPENRRRPTHTSPLRTPAGPTQWDHKQRQQQHRNVTHSFERTTQHLPQASQLPCTDLESDAAVVVPVHLFPPIHTKDAHGLCAEAGPIAVRKTTEVTSHRQPMKRGSETRRVNGTLLIPESDFSAISAITSFLRDIMEQETRHERESRRGWGVEGNAHKGAK